MAQGIIDVNLVVIDSVTTLIQEKKKKKKFQESNSNLDEEDWRWESTFSRETKEGDRGMQQDSSTKVEANIDIKPYSFVVSVGNIIR